MYFCTFMYRDNNKTSAGQQECLSQIAGAGNRAVNHHSLIGQYSGSGGWGVLINRGKWLSSCVCLLLMMSSALKRVFLWGLTWSLSVFAARRPCTPPHTWSLELGEMFKSCYLVVSCLKSLEWIYYSVKNPMNTHINTVCLCQETHAVWKPDRLQDIWAQ